MWNLGNIITLKEIRLSIAKKLGTWKWCNIPKLKVSYIKTKIQRNETKIIIKDILLSKLGCFLIEKFVNSSMQISSFSFVTLKVFCLYMFIKMSHPYWTALRFPSRSWCLTARRWNWKWTDTRHLSPDVLLQDWTQISDRSCEQKWQNFFFSDFFFTINIQVQSSC